MTIHAVTLQQVKQIHPSHRDNRDRELTRSRDRDQQRKFKMVASHCFSKKPAYKKPFARKILYLTRPIINSNVDDHAHIQLVVAYSIKLGPDSRVVESKRMDIPNQHYRSCILKSQIIPFGAGI